MSKKLLFIRHNERRKSFQLLPLICKVGVWNTSGINKGRKQFTPMRELSLPYSHSSVSFQTLPYENKSVKLNDM